MNVKIVNMKQYRMFTLHCTLQSYIYLYLNRLKLERPDSSASLSYLGLPGLKLRIQKASKISPSSSKPQHPSKITVIAVRRSRFGDLAKVPEFAKTVSPIPYKACVANTLNHGKQWLAKTENFVV